jgi:replication initiation factor
MKGVIHLDTLYLIVKYPKLDVFNNWYKHAERAEYRVLKEGIRHGDFVVKNGASCYKCSVWQHDARVFLTDQVDEKVGDGKGSGVWIQLGPKFLIENIYRLQTAVRELLAAIGIHGEYPSNINRVDIAIDLFNVEMKDQDIALWQNGWVGRSKISDLHFNSRTSALETINIGSRNSSVFLRVYDKVAQAEKEGDIVYWRDVWKGHSGAVTRIEWEIKPKKGHFAKDLQDFSLFNGFTIRETLAYLLDWGRLCNPNPDDSNNRRWHDSELWQQVRELVAEFSEGVDYPISRYGKEFHGISDAYVNFLSGTLAGGIARFGLDQDNPSMINLINGLEKHGRNLEAINRVAKRKATLYSKL